tara:strand:- start:3937 stop:4527 length:591 start_codon:yes stop_codon:yes gene_type:complete
MIKMSLIFVAVGLLFLLAAWFMVPMFLEQPKYKILKKEGQFEIRSYDDILMSSVRVTGSQYQALRKGFRPLVKYISGKERDGEKISMTAPVIQSTSDRKESFTVSFSMPSKYQVDNLPKSTNSEIFFEKVGSYRAAVVRFSGRANEKLLDLKSNELRQWIEANGYSSVSTAKYLFYNDPSTPGFLRRNEVMIIIDK